MNNALAGTAPFVYSPLHSCRAGLLLVWIDLKQGIRKHLAGNTWRDRLLQAGGALFGFLFLAGLHVAAFSLVSYAWLSPSENKGALMAGISTAIWSFLLFVMVSGGLMRALVVLHEQDDSNLLLSSPVSPRAVLAARLFGNALQSCLVDGFIIVPYIDVRLFILGGNPRFLWGYAVWFALAIIVTCVDGLISFGLIRWLGLRKARHFSQFVPFILIFGVTFFAGSLSISVGKMSQEAGGTQMPPIMQSQFIALCHTPLVALARAAVGAPAYLAMIFGVAGALALITLRLTERAFVQGTQHLSENATTAPPGAADAPFRSGVLALEVRKNLRLIVRTPMMLVQCIAQVLTPVGIAFVLGHQDLGLALAFFSIFAAGVLSGMLTIASGTVEECEDLLHMSPGGTRIFRYAKILSGCLWPLGLALLAGLGLLVAGRTLQAAGVFLAGIPLGLAAGIVGETFATPVRPGMRPKLLADPIMIIPLFGMQITSGAIAGVTVFAASYSLPFLLLSLLAVYLLLVFAVGLAQLRKPLFDRRSY
jgi:ABC-2 type transport system permease protein